VQRAFYPEGEDVAHVYVLHPPGGLVGGDRLELDVSVCARSSALLTTPAAQKLYRSGGRTSRQRAKLRVEEGASLEWLPGENIVFQGADGVLETEVEVAPGGTFAGWDIGCFGRPAAGERFEQGRLRSAFRLSRNGRPLLVERFELCGGSSQLTEAWGFSGFPVFGNLYFVPPDERDLAPLAALFRERLAPGAGERFAVTALESTLVARVLAPNAERARALLVAAWELARPELLGRAPVPPRVWAT
jgi:urease accessory protein